MSAFVLVLDDDEKRLARFSKKYPQAVLTRTVEECITHLQAQTFDVIYLDHDLGGETYVDTTREDTGSEVARFLAAGWGKPPKLGGHYQSKTTYIICHSLNYDGRMNMVSILKLSGFEFIQGIPFTSLKL